MARKTNMLVLGAWCALLVASTAPCLAQRQPHTFFRDTIKFTDAEISKIDQGQVVTKKIDDENKYGLLVVGAVYINATIDEFAEVFRDFESLEKERVYQIVKGFGNPPKLSDFDRLALTNKDIDELEDCKPGDCEIQIRDFDAIKDIDWKSNDRYDNINRMVRKRVFDGMELYGEGGLKSLGSYRDRKKPLNLYEATKAMLDRSSLVPRDRAPEIYDHLIDYPASKKEGAEDIFYWEKIDFGQEPTFRVNHATLFPGGAGAVKYVAVIKQLFSSRYMRVAAQLFYCVPDTQNPNRPGFYLIEVNDSQLPDFGGFKLAIVKRIAGSTATEATTDALTIYHRKLSSR